MESGLEGRNNAMVRKVRIAIALVSMESGLEGRNNSGQLSGDNFYGDSGLNGVRPRRPEQFKVWV